MKDQFDLNTVERQFKPGDKVLVLLPIPGNPLQARYYGPCVIDKKVGDVDYIVLTPNRRKQTQLCHVNMIKEYHERPDSGVKQSEDLSSEDNKTKDTMTDISVPKCTKDA